ncbi:MAG: IPExxxVDY family protein [Bacteroidia bacterium]|jgi:hypothetical protein
MKKLAFKDYADFDFKLIGISCQEPDFKLCWYLNNHLNLNLERTDDLTIPMEQDDKLAHYSVFEYKESVRSLDGVQANWLPPYLSEAEEEGTLYQLLSNRNEWGNLIPEQPTIDFFLLLRGSNEDEVHQKKKLQLIRQIKVVNAAFLMDINKLKSRDNLIF